MTRSMTRYGMLIDLSRCVGCNACTVSCKASNSTPEGVFFTHVDKVESGKFPNTQVLFLPRGCMQCKDASCVTVCPTHATYKRSDGIVMARSEQMHWLQVLHCRMSVWRANIHE